MTVIRTISLLICAVVTVGATATAAGSVPTSPATDLPAMPTNMPTTIPQKRGVGEMPLEYFNYLKDCLVVNVKDGQQQFAAWMPLKTFLRMYAAGGGDSDQLEAKVDELRPYLMFMVENRVTDQYKNPTSESAESLRRRARLRLPDGSEVKPLDHAPEGMPANPPSFGSLGRRGQLLIFPSGDTSSDLDSDSAHRGKLELVLQADDVFKKSSFTWHLPLELAGTTKQCTKCHNELSGKWSYCPWCGVRPK